MSHHTIAPTLQASQESVPSRFTAGDIQVSHEQSHGGFDFGGFNFERVLQLPSVPYSGLLMLQRQVGNQAVRRLIQRGADSSGMGERGGEVSSGLTKRIQQAKGRGSPLDKKHMNQFGPAFGTDFSGVRVHTDAESHQLNEALNAKAFTLEQDIFFRHGAYDPGSVGGQGLLLHELTHVVQQTEGSSSISTPQAQLEVGPTNDPLEEEADLVARQVQASLQRAQADSQTSGQQSTATFDMANEASAQEPVTPMWPRSDLHRRVLRKRFIQRLAYNDAPSTWKPVDRIARSGEGIKGVYFVSKGSDRIVVKPEPYSPGPIEFANNFISQGMGFEAPEMVAYEKVSEEGKMIAGLLTDGPVQGLRKPEEATDQLKKAKYITVMNTVKGRSIQSLDDTEALEFVTNAEAIQQVGKLLVTDVFLGNEDRLSFNVNLGNFFYQTADSTKDDKGRIATIDNTSSFEAYDSGNELEKKRKRVEWLFTDKDRRGFGLAFLDKLLTALSSREKALAAIDSDFITGNFNQGIDDGLAEIASVFTDNMALVSSIQSIHEKYGDDESLDQGSAKGLGHYIKVRASGTQTKEVASQNLRRYVQYRKRRKATVKGLKWWERWTSRTGF